MYAGPHRRDRAGRSRCSPRPRHPYTALLLAALPRLTDVPKSRTGGDRGPGATPAASSPPPCRFAGSVPVGHVSSAGSRTAAAGGIWGARPALRLLARGPASERSRHGPRLVTLSGLVVHYPRPAAARRCARWTGCRCTHQRRARRSAWSGESGCGKSTDRPGPSLGCRRPTARFDPVVDGTCRSPGLTASTLHRRPGAHADGVPGSGHCRSTRG